MSEKRVYFLRPVGQLGPIKIGCSKLPELRLDTFTIWSPVRLEFVCSAPGTHKDERTLHGMFAKHRVHGEWFGASKELLALIDHCQTTGQLPVLPEVVQFPKVQHVGYRNRAKGKREAGELPPHKLAVGRTMRAQYESGLPVKTLAAEHGVNPLTATKYIRAVGGVVSSKITGRFRAGVADTERAQEFKRRYLAGETLQQIGDTYGLTRERVRQILRKIGVGSLGHRPWHHPPHELTENEIAAARAYDQGTRPGEACAKYCVTRSQLLSAVKRLGFRVRGTGEWLTRPDDAEITAEVARLYQAGFSAPQIVKRVPQLKFPETVYRYLKKAGVPPRTRKGNFRRRAA